MYGLTETELQDLIGVCTSNIKVEKVVLFGSRAKGNFKSGSDIDIALYAPSLNFNEFLQLYSKCQLH